MTQERHYNLSAGSTALANGSGLGFSALSCIIQNPTPCWWYLPDQLHYVPPFVINHVVALLGSEVAKIVYAAPPGVTQSINAATADGQTTSFLFVDISLPPDSGYVGYSAYGPQARKYDLFTVVCPTPGFQNIKISTPAADGFTFIINSAPVGNFLYIVIFAIFLPGPAFQSRNFIRLFANPSFIGSPSVQETPEIIIPGYYPAGTLITLTMQTQPLVPAAAPQPGTYQFGLIY